LVTLMPRRAFPANTHPLTPTHTHTHLHTQSTHIHTYSYALSHDHDHVQWAGGLMGRCWAGNCFNIPEIAGELHKLTRNAPRAQFNVMRLRHQCGQRKRKCCHMLKGITYGDQRGAIVAESVQEVKYILTSIQIHITSWKQTIFKCRINL